MRQATYRSDTPCDLSHIRELASTYTHVQWDNEEWHSDCHLGTVTWDITYKLELASTYTHVQWDKWGVTHLGTVTYINETYMRRTCLYRLSLPHLSQWDMGKWGAPSLICDIYPCPMRQMRSDSPWDSDLSHIGWSLPLYIPMSNETNEEWHTLGQWPITYKLELASTYTHVQWDKWGVTHLGTVTYHI